jgi:hypothetical protein
MPEVTLTVFPPAESGTAHGQNAERPLWPQIQKIQKRQ